MKYKPCRLCCVRYTYDESRLETKRFENCMFCMSQDSRMISKSNEYIKTLLLMSTTGKVLHTDEPRMINTTHLFGKIYHKLLSAIINRVKKEQKKKSSEQINKTTSYACNEQSVQNKDSISKIYSSKI